MSAPREHLHHDIDVAAFSMDRWSVDTNSPSFERFAVGVDYVRISYHEPRGEGDQHYVTGHHGDGSATRFFRPRTVEFLP